MQFVKAERKQAKLRLAIESASGGGKTHSALLIAKGLGGKIALIDTEHGSGSLEAGKPNIPEYDTLELDPPFTPKRYIEAIKAGEQAGYNVIILDSITHEWQGEGGTLDAHDKATAASRSGNSYTAWKEVTPEHDKLINAILQSPCHIIATIRTKQDYAQTTDNKGKTIIKKLGMAPIQREGTDYEFTVVLDLSQDHIATASKDRTSLFDGMHFKPSEETGKQLLAWLESGKAIEKPIPPIKPANKSETKEPTTNDPTKTPGSNDWILAKMKESNFSETGVIEYFATALKLSTADTVKETLDKLTASGEITDEHRQTIAKAFNARSSLPKPGPNLRA